MTAVPTIPVALGRLRTIALATALSCTASVAHADFASVVIDGFSVSSTSEFGTFVFAPTDTMSQAWDLQVLTDGVLVQENSNSLGSWDPADGTAQGPHATATVSTFQFTDPFTQLITPGFTLAASVDSFPTGPLYTALGNILSSGTFCFYDEFAPPPYDGTSSSCNGSGSLTFTVFYDLIVETSAGVPDSAYAEINVLGTGVPGGLFFDFASTALGDESKYDQFFTWTADLTAGSSASFAIAGTVVAEAVPEPGVLSLAALGLLGLYATRRRNGARAAA